MNIPNLALALLTAPHVPPALLRATVRLAVALLRWRQAREDRRQAAAPPTHPTPAGPVYLVDGYHGGVVFWDWLVLPGGGLWYLYNWPLCLQPAIERALRDDRFRVTLDLDGWTYEDMAVRAPEAIRQMREALRLGHLEIVNGTYGQPLALSVSGESFIRQLFYGLEAIRRVLGAEVTVFYSQEPAYFPQLPQILRGFGFQGVILRTQWAAFGTDPACDAAVARWQGPDGSTIPAVPRYTFQRYDRLRADHPGLPHMALAAGERADWEPESLAPFERAARERGIAHPLVTDLKDVNLPDAPLPHALALAATPNVRFVTPTEYFALAGEEGPTVSYTPDDIPSTLLWGLQAEELMRARVAAERALLVAERLDAVAYLLGRESQEEHLAEAWKHLCLAQHHDLHVCGPWHSRRHGCSMAEVGMEYAERARRAAEEVSRAALAHLAEAAGGNILVFNPSPWPRREYVEVPWNRIYPALWNRIYPVLDRINPALWNRIYPVLGRINPALWNRIYPVLGRINPALWNRIYPVLGRINPALPISPELRLVDDEGEVPCQWVSAGDGNWRVSFALDLPPLGYRCLRWVPDQAAAEKEPFQNPWYRATVHPDGSLRVEADGQPLITAGGYLTVWRDGAWHDSRTSVRRVEVSKEGPVCCRYRIEGEVAGIPFCQTVTLYRALPRIDGCVVLDFGEGVYLGPQMEDDRPERAMSVQDEKKLCLAFATPLRRAWCDSPFLVARTGRESIVGLHGVRLEDGDGAGVAFFHRGTPGYHLDRREGVLRNVLAWGPREWIYASDNSVTRGRSRYTALRGRQEYEYAILPYTPRGARFVLPRAALDFQLPCRWQMLRALSGRPAVPRSFLSVEPESVLVTALFVHRGRVYLRLWNASGQETVAAIHTPWVREWHPVDLRLQRDGAPLPSDSIPLPPWGIRTLEI